jgi:cell division cycle protein 37
VSKLSAGREARGSKDGPEGPIPDDMVLSLLLQINEDASVKGKSGDDLDTGLTILLKDHIEKLAERQKQVIDGIDKIEAEDKKKITSDGIKEGWSSSHITKDVEEEVPAPKPSSSKGKKKETTIETLNAPSTSTSSQSDLSPDSDAEDEEETPELLPMMLEFAKLPASVPNLPLHAGGLPPNFNPARDVKPEPFNQALQYLSSHKQLVRESVNTTDALLVEAFQAQMRGEASLSRKCVEKALLIQYCNKLGKDGVNLFFRR